MDSQKLLSVIKSYFAGQPLSFHGSIKIKLNNQWETIIKNGKHNTILLIPQDCKDFTDNMSTTIYYYTSEKDILDQCSFISKNQELFNEFYNPDDLLNNSHKREYNDEYEEYLQ